MSNPVHSDLVLFSETGEYEVSVPTYIPSFSSLYAIGYDINGAELGSFSPRVVRISAGCTETTFLVIIEDSVGCSSFKLAVHL